MEADGHESPTQSGGLALVIVQYHNIQGIGRPCWADFRLTKFESYGSLDLWHLWFLGLAIRHKRPTSWSGYYSYHEPSRTKDEERKYTELIPCDLWVICGHWMDLEPLFMSLPSFLWRFLSEYLASVVLEPHFKSQPVFSYHGHVNSEWTYIPAYIPTTYVPT